MWLCQQNKRESFCALFKQSQGIKLQNIGATNSLNVGAAGILLIWYFSIYLLVYEQYIAHIYEALNVNIGQNVW